MDEERYSAAWSGSVLWVVRFSQFGVTRKIDSGALSTEAGADKGRVKAQKVLLDAPEYDAIAKHYADVRRWVGLRTVPAEFLGTSVHVCKRDRVDELTAYIADARGTLNTLLTTFSAFYDARVNQARQSLGSLFDPSQYPRWSDVRDRYAIRSRFISVGPASGLGASISEDELSGFVTDWRATVDDARAALRAEFAGLVGYFADRLRDKPDGARSRFGGNFGKLETLREFCDLFSARDLSSDGDLRAMAERVKGMLAGVRADTLRDSASMRGSMAASFAEVKREAGSLIVTSRRAFDFGDDAAVS